MTKRRVVLNAEVDSARAFPILINYSNLSHNKDGTVPMYLDDIVALRAQLPMKKGVFATHGLSENKVHDLQAGAGLLDDGRKYIRSGVKYVRGKAGDLLEYGSNKGIDYASGYAKDKVGDMARKVRGGSFLRKLAGKAIRGVAGVAADAIGGGANIRPRRRPAKALVHTPEQEMALQPEMEGNGFFRKILSSGVRGIGNIAADAIGGGVKKRKGRKGKAKKGAKKGRKQGSGLVAAGMSY